LFALILQSVNFILFHPICVFFHKHFQIGFYFFYKTTKPRNPNPLKMTCHLSITMHNMLPENPSVGIHVPFHTITMDPFRKPFTFGPRRCDVKNGSHIGLQSDVAVAASFLGMEGEFFVMSKNQFVILTPKAGIPVTVGSALFPKDTTHDMHVAETEKSYPISVGTVIMAYNMDQMPSLNSVTIFMGSNPTTNLYHSAQGAMAQSLMYFNDLWKAISNERCVNKEAFKPEEVSREKYPDMRLVMTTYHKPPLTLNKPPNPSSSRKADQGETHTAKKMKTV